MGWLRETNLIHFDNIWQVSFSLSHLIGQFKGLFKRTQQCWPNIMQQFSNSVLCCFFCKYFNAPSFNWNKSYRIIKTFEKQAIEPSVSSLLYVGPTLLGPFEQALTTVRCVVFTVETAIRQKTLWTRREICKLKAVFHFRVFTRTYTHEKL